jgi:hypothetical protein
MKIKHSPDQISPDSKQFNKLNKSRRKLKIGLGGFAGAVVLVGAATSFGELKLYNASARSKDMAEFATAKTNQLVNESSRQNQCLNDTVVLKSGDVYRKYPDSLNAARLRFPLDLLTSRDGDIAGRVPVGQVMIIHKPMEVPGQTNWLEFSTSNVASVADGKIYPVGDNSSLSQAETRIRYINKDSLVYQSQQNHSQLISLSQIPGSTNTTSNCSFDYIKGLDIESDAQPAAYSFMADKVTSMAIMKAFK